MNCPKCGAPVAPGSTICGICASPVSAGGPPAAAPVSAAPAAAPAQPQAQKSGGGKGCLIFGCLGVGCLGLIAAVVLGGGFIAWKNKDQIRQAIEEAERAAETPATEAPAAEPAAPAATPAPAVERTEAPATTAERGTARVSLRWNAAVDMDLEIWNEEGTEILFRAWNKMGQDVTDGRAGEEYFEFRRVDGDDYSRGTYVVSIYFAARSDESVDAADAVVTVRRPDGTTATRRKRIQWEPGVDQWHAFKLDAATGRITDLDRFIRVRQQT